MRRPAQLPATLPVTVVVMVLWVSYLAPRAGAALDPAPSLGRVASQNIALDGVRVPAGTTVLSPSVLATDNRPARVELSNGQLLVLAAHSQALLESTPKGGVQVAVQGGTVAYRSPSGEEVTLGENSLLLLGQEGQIREGTQIRRQVGMCHLIDWELEMALQCLNEPDGKGCKWELIEVNEDEVEERLKLGDVIAGDNDIGLDEDCRDKVVGLTTAKKVGLGLGSALLAGVILDDDEEPEPASPVQPRPRP